MDESPRCPECANELQSEDDVICLHCGFNLKTRTSARTVKIKDVTPFGLFLWLLPGILAAIGFFTSVGLFIYLVNWRFTVTWESTTEQLVILAFEGFILWSCIACVFVGYKTARFAIKRLIQHPKPPEQELS